MSRLRSCLDQIFNRLSPDAAAPSISPFERYVAAARKMGFDRPCLFLSFDCDTDLDADAAIKVHAFLESMGIQATYAVPGAQLRKFPESYRRLAERGAEFMNHGGLPHAARGADRWIGITFYDAMAPEAVEEDIRRGHEIVIETIGSVPKGFRAPHFGCYQKPEQVERLHRSAANLGYRYCSTTIPAFALKHGPAYETHGLVEIPCFGSARHPETILDSWTYLTDRKNYALGDPYFELMAETVEFFLERQIPAVFTWYADPCHVIDQTPFRRAMELLARLDIRSVSGRDIAAMACPRQTAEKSGSPSA